MSDKVASAYVLPAALIGRADLARLVREVESVDNDLEVQKVRAGGEKAAYQLPTMSKSLGDFLTLNKIDITDNHVRMDLKQHMRVLKDHAPIIHMTFAVEADPDFLSELVAWVRKEIHPQALITVGLQPSLVGGVHMRTPNHVHDFSVRKLLAGKRDIIMHELETVNAR